MRYAEPGFDPVTGELWAFEVQDSTEILTNITTGVTAGSLDASVGGNALAFAPGQEIPATFEVPYDTPPPGAWVQAAPITLTDQSDYGFNEVTLDSSGTGTYAFVAADPSGEGRAIFTWDGQSTPVRVSTIDSGEAMALIRYATAA
ncbi:unannotated protein [freshwater metagenome]|uniref:Unannotated protein n=1 Tax=freshwater metagenome TaxID=449393 RepID=A0A6J6QFB8_9ZZZZ